MFRAWVLVVAALAACGDDAFDPYKEPLSGYHVTPIASPADLDTSIATLTPGGQYLFDARAAGQAGAVWSPTPLMLPPSTRVKAQLAGEELWFFEEQALAVWTPSGERLVLPDVSDDPREEHPNDAGTDAPLWHRNREIGAIGPGGEVWGVTYAFASPVGSPPMGRGFARAFVWHPGDATLHALGEHITWTGPRTDGSRVSIHLAPSGDAVVRTSEAANLSVLVHDYVLTREGTWTDVAKDTGLELGSMFTVPTHDGVFLSIEQSQAVWRNGKLTQLLSPVLAVAPSGWAVLGTEGGASLRSPDGDYTRLPGFAARAFFPIALDDEGRMLVPDGGFEQTAFVLLTPDSLPDPTPHGTLELADVQLPEPDVSPIVMHAGGVNLTADGKRLWLRLRSEITSVELGPQDAPRHVRELQLSILRVTDTIELGVPYPVDGRAGAINKAGVVYTDAVIKGRSPTELWGKSGTVTVERTSDGGMRVTLTDVEVASLGSGAQHARLSGTLEFPVVGSLPL